MAAADKSYAVALRHLQVELVKLQRHVIDRRHKVVIVLEGRDGAGKDGTIKALTEHMSPRDTRIVALGKPSGRERRAWYFQRYVPYLPTGGEIVLFNRSWYNRAGVEAVMGFCTRAETEDFLASVPVFEDLLVRSGIHLVKYYLDIDRAEQRRRLAARQRDPLKQWKISPIDDAALDKWKDYSRARDIMLARTSTAAAPWTVVQANSKPAARLALIRDLLGRFDYPGKAKARWMAPDRSIAFPFDLDAVRDGRLAR